MAGAMRKMAVYLGLVEDDGYDGRGFDPDDDFEPELEPEPERDRRHTPRDRWNARSRYAWCSRRPSGNRSLILSRYSPKADVRPELPPWHPSHPNARAWRRTHR